MAPTKFGLFKARSRDYQEQPSTENLIHTSNSSDQVTTPQSPIPSTSKGITNSEYSPDLSTLCLDSDDEVDNEPQRRPSLDQGSLVNLDEIIKISPNKDPHDFDDASTTYDANSLAFDENSLAGSEDVFVNCKPLKKVKKIRAKTEKYLRDMDMWKASDVEVMQNLLKRSGTLDDQIKWEAIATARGLCTLTDNCTCGDCTNCKFLAGVSDGDGGLAAAPFLSAVNVGCRLQ